MKFGITVLLAAASTALAHNTTLQRVTKTTTNLEAHGSASTSTQLPGHIVGINGHTHLPGHIIPTVPFRSHRGPAPTHAPEQERGVNFPPPLTPFPPDIEGYRPHDGPPRALWPPVSAPAPAPAPPPFSSSSSSPSSSGTMARRAR
ncbi:hypothetical protein F4778DRAFT_715951 [Xylariomycetidae sp. FL2044]|nr:hypothetical protein F4778DRAFT_715951 [Xylariomycetidae sp. FL2044]